MKLLRMITVVVAASGLTAAASVGAAPLAAPTCDMVALGTGAGGNGMTGGTIEWSISLTNRGARPCEVVGRPVVTVRPGSSPVTVRAVRPSEFGPGTPGVLARRVVLAPNASAHAPIFVLRGPCAFSRDDAATLHVGVGFGPTRVVVSGEECRREGGVVAVGAWSG